MNNGRIFFLALIVLLVSIFINIYLKSPNFPKFFDEFPDISLRANNKNRILIEREGAIEIYSKDIKTVLNHLYSFLSRVFRNNFIHLSNTYKIKSLFGKVILITEERNKLRTIMDGNKVYETKVKLYDSNGKVFVTSIYILSSFSGFISTKNINTQIYVKEENENNFYKKELIKFDPNFVNLAQNIVRKYDYYTNNLRNSFLDYSDYIAKGLINFHHDLPFNILRIKKELINLTHLIFKEEFINLGHIRKGFIMGTVKIIRNDGKIEKIKLNNESAVYEAIIEISDNNKRKNLCFFIYIVEEDYNVIYVKSKSNNVYYFPVDNFGIKTNNESYRINVKPYLKEKFNEFSQKLKEESINQKKITKKIIKLSKEFLNINDSKYREEIINNNIYKKFIVDEIDSNNSSQVKAGLYIASRRAFGSRFINILSYKRILSNRIMQILQPDGTTKLFKFEGKTATTERVNNENLIITYLKSHYILEAQVLFKSNEKEGDQQVLDVYYLSDCYNPIRYWNNSTSNNTFSHLEDNNETYSKDLDNAYFNYDKLFEESIKRLYNKASVNMDLITLREKSRNIINANDILFKEEVELNTQNNKRFIVENVNHDLYFEVASAIIIASHRAFSNRFLKLISFRKGIAYGNMEVLQPDGLIKNFIFEGKRVKFTTIEASGNITENYFKEFTYIYEGKVQLKKDDNIDINREIIEINVYYFSNCFNPLRYSLNLTSNVTFYPIDSNETVVLYPSQEFNDIFQEAQSKLYNSTHSRIKLHNTTIEIKAKYKIIGIIDNSSSMNEILEEAKIEAIKIIGDQNLFYFSGCFFSSNLDSNSMTKLIHGIIRDNSKIGAIYIFSDFQDYVDPYIFSVLFPLFHENNIKLYLNSLQHSPSEFLSKISEATGGEVTISKLNNIFK